MSALSRRALLAGLAGALGGAALAQGAPEVPAPIIVAARRYQGRLYTFGGRGRTLDCMGLVFLAWADTTGRDWRSLSVNPTQLVARRQLGRPVAGLDGVTSARIPWALLRSGDVLFFLGPAENPNEPALVSLDGVPHWVWHMGLWVGGSDQAFIVGDHYAGRVVEQPLAPYLAEHADVYAGIYVVRP